MKISAILAGLCLLALPLPAQSQSQLKSELRKMEAAAKSDPEALVAAAEWAKEKGLDADAKRLFQKALRLDPDNEAANTGLGNERFEGQWMPASKAEELRRKARAAEFKAAGLVEVDGVWVEKDQVADAKKGIFHHGDDLVTHAELLALQGGKVRHPVTGELIAAEELEKATANQFPVGTEGRWGSEEDADAWHRSASRPWVLRTHYCTLVSTLPLQDVLALKQEVDRGFEKVQPVLNFVRPTPSHRPVVFVAKDPDQYKQFGDDHGDAGSSYGAFLAIEPRDVDGVGSVLPAFCVWEKDWGPYYARHATGLSYLHGVCTDIEAEVPRWFLRGVGSYASRFYDNRLAGYFGEQHIAKGGVKDLGSFFREFTISGDLTPSDNAYNVYQAGLMLSFAVQGGNAKVTEAMKAVTDALEQGKARNVAKAIDVLEGQLVAHEDEIRAYLQKLVQNKDR